MEIFQLYLELNTWTSLKSRSHRYFNFCVHHFFVYVFARKRQVFCACRAVSVRELCTAVREWACCRVIIQIYNSVTLAMGYFVDKHSKISVHVYIRFKRDISDTACKNIYTERQLG